MPKSIIHYRNIYFTDISENFQIILYSFWLVKEEIHKIQRIIHNAEHYETFSELT